MHEGPDLSTTPVPPPRVPTHDTLPVAPAEPGAAEAVAAEPGVAEAVVAAEPGVAGAVVAAEPGVAGAVVAAEPGVAEAVAAAEPIESERIGPGGTERDGSDPNGSDPNGSDPNGSDPNGPEQSVSPETAPGKTASEQLASGAPMVAVPVDELGIGAPKSTWRVRALLAGGAAIAVLLAGFVVLRPGSSPEAAAQAAPSGKPAPSASASPATPYDMAVAALNAQTAALVNGDENGWLAAVDPKLKARYRSLFRNLRGLGVSGLHYEPDAGQTVKGDPTAVAITVDLVYCFTADMCPEHPASKWGKGPRIAQKLTLKPLGGAYVIASLGAAPQPDSHQPTPWENGDLTFAQGKRVVVAAGAGEEKYLSTVLPVAEHAATVADHYAALNGTPQKRYRIFLASEKQWSTWYGGENDKWAIGLSMPLNKRGIDVILRMADMDDALTLATTVQHELGHVVTLTGAFQYDAGEDTWLSEGIAEYIGWKPRSAAQSLRRYSVRWQLNRSPMRSMVPVEPGAKAPARAGDAFYGLSHLAVDCMAHQYGETKLFDFVRLVLTDDNELDQAAQDAYGVPFKTVDKTCMAWIKKQV